MNRLVEETVTDAEGNELEKYEYTFGNAGEKLSVSSHDETVSYTYDELLRLTGEKVTKADAFMSGCIAAGFAAAAILGVSLGSVAVMVAIGGSGLIFAVLSLIAAYQAGECGYDDLALIYSTWGCRIIWSG